MAYLSKITTAFAIVGAAVGASFLFKVASFIALYVRKGDLQRYNHQSPDGRQAWAIVTGASDGIGRALAHSLASKGFNVVVHGRNSSKLGSVLTSLEESFPARSFRMLIADASKVKCKNCLASNSSQNDDGVDFPKIMAELGDLHVTVLVNNIGGGPKFPSLAPLQEYSELDMATYVSSDALFALRLTQALLPRLIQNKPSLVMTMDSMADYGSPYLSFYSASKAMVLNFSTSMRLERNTEGQGDVEFLGIRIGNVTGVSWRKDKPSFAIPSAEVMAEASLAKVGCGRARVEGYWVHGLMAAITEFVPQRVADMALTQACIDIMMVLREKEKKAKEL
jgi:17beta-estradiol 17-dehydrogenase / very-long-chain 3-oxoacyl-CoA reductase